MFSLFVCGVSGAMHPAAAALGAALLGLLSILLGWASFHTLLVSQRGLLVDGSVCQPSVSTAGSVSAHL